MIPIFHIHKIRRNVKENLRLENLRLENLRLISESLRDDLPISKEQEKKDSGWNTISYERADEDEVDFYVSRDLNTIKIIQNLIQQGYRKEVAEDIIGIDFYTVDNLEDIHEYYILDYNLDDCEGDYLVYSIDQMVMADIRKTEDDETYYYIEWNGLGFASSGPSPLDFYFIDDNIGMYSGITKEFEVIGKNHIMYPKLYVTLSETEEDEIQFVKLDPSMEFDIAKKIPYIRDAENSSICISFGHYSCVENVLHQEYSDNLRLPIPFIIEALIEEENWEIKNYGPEFEDLKNLLDKLTDLGYFTKEVT